MDILFEAIGELLSELYGWIVTSERVPRGVRTALVLVLTVPLSVLMVFCTVGSIRKSSMTGTIFCGLCLLGFSLIGIFLLRRIWKRR